MAIEHIPTRTYVENPDGYLAEYAIEDHVRDIDYTVNKHKQFIAAMFPDAPGFITYPNITYDSETKSKLFIPSFIAVDNALNGFVFKEEGAYGRDEFEPGERYYITLQVNLEATLDTRVNKRQRNKPYTYVLKETKKILFSTMVPFGDLCLGSYTVDLDTELGEYVATYSTIGRSPLLVMTAGKPPEREEVVSLIGGDFVKKLSYTESDGDVVVLTSEETFTMPTGRLLVPGLGTDGKISKQLIDSKSILLESSNILELPGGGTITVIEGIDPERQFELWNGQQSFYGTFIFTTGGGINTIIAAATVQTQETPLVSNDPNILYIETALVDDLINISIKNNYADTKKIRYSIR